MRRLAGVKRHLHAEDGVGLVELLVAISVTGILVPALGAAIYFGFRASGDSQTRLQEANGARILSSFFVPDVQGAQGCRPGRDRRCVRQQRSDAGPRADDEPGARARDNHLLLPRHRLQLRRALPARLQRGCRRRRVTCRAERRRRDLLVRGSRLPAGRALLQQLDPKGAVPLRTELTATRRPT